VELVPESATLSSKPCAFSGNTDVLAGESAADDINSNSVCSQSSCGECLYVIVYRHHRPMFFKYGAAKIVDFAKRYGRHACAF
jgi:hypothetical protein